MFHRFAINVYALQDECICFHRESGIEWRWKQIVTRFSSREENLLTVVYRLSMYSRRGETRDDRERESGEIFEINCDRLLPFPFIPASFFALLFYFFSFSSFLSFFFFSFFHRKQRYGKHREDEKVNFSFARGKNEIQNGTASKPTITTRRKGNHHVNRTEGKQIAKGSFGNFFLLLLHFYAYSYTTERMY